MTAREDTDPFQAILARHGLHGHIHLTNEIAAHVAARVAEALAPIEAALDRVRDLHTQTSEIGLAPGKWCPACGDETPCRTLLATLTPPPHLGHLSREELRRRAMDYDEGQEAAQRQRESAEVRAAMEGRLTDAPDARTHGLNHAPLPPGKWLAPGFCNGCDEERARATVEPTP